MIALHLLGLGIAAFWLGVAIKVRAGRKKEGWKLGPDAPVDVPLPHLAVVVPARNEAANIAACVAALRASDHPDLTVWVFDDGSTDDTARLAALAGAKVVQGGGGDLPAGWKGKPWALQRATRGIPGDWVLFVDADVRVKPGALSRAHAYAIREGVDLLSGFGKLVMDSFWEKVIQPSVGGLILAGNDLDKANDAAQPERAIANGQFILVRRDAYEAVGGHGAVRDDILDDIGLARAFARAGKRSVCLFMRELFSCRMYTSLRELWLGWTKNLYAGMGHRLDRVVFLAGFVLVDFVLPYGLVVAGLVSGSLPMVAWGLGLVLLIQAVRFWMDGIFDQDRRYGLLQVLGALALVGLLVDSARRSRAGTVQWKGRQYAVKPSEVAALPVAAAGAAAGPDAGSAAGGDGAA